MKTIRFGTIVGFKFDEERDSKKNPGTKVHIIRIYADPKFVNKEWIKEQEDLEKQYGSPQPKFFMPKNEVGVNQTVTQETREKAEETDPFESDDSDEIFKKEEKTPVAGNSDETLIAIRNLAKTKGLTKEKMTVEEADKAIEKYTELELKEENLTKVIIALTGYTDK